MTYLWMIALLTLPVLAVEWAIGWKTLLLEWRPLVATIAMATAYLGCASIVALRDGIWNISSAHTIGLRGGGFVFEEWLMLLATNAVIAQTVILALDSEARAKFRRVLWPR
ncbi:MAG: hypothetical protein ACRDG3_06595 [Tepidiformaceae bacterium]